MLLPGLIILALVLLAIYCWYTHLHECIYEQMEESNGAFDPPARRALATLAQLPRKTSIDRFNEGRLMELNQYEGRVIDRRDLRRVARNYLDRLEDREVDFFEIDQIEHFVARHHPMLAEDPETHELLRAAPVKRPQKVADVIQTVKAKGFEEGASRKIMLDQIAKESGKITSDKQNVHDSGVNQQLRETLYQLRKKSFPLPDPTQVWSEVEQRVENDRDDARRTRMKVSLKEVKNDAWVDTLKANEKEILTLVWGRSHMPENATRKELIQDAVLAGLSDMSPNGVNVVCENGRAARLIESLVCTDADPNVAPGASTLEQIRHDAFQRTRERLDEYIAQVKESRELDPEMGKVAISYEDPSVQVDPAVERQFKQNAIKIIKDDLHTTYRSKLTEDNYKALENHCTLAIDAV